MQKWNHTAALKWKTASHSSLAETQSFTAHHVRAAVPPPTSLVGDQLLSSDLCVLLFVSKVIAFEESPDRSQQSLCVLSDISGILCEAHLTGGIHSFIKHSPVMRLTMENKQERDHAHCAGCQREGVDVEPHPPHT